MNRNPVQVSHRHAPRDSAKPLNPRQELFAQALARGMSQAAAYREAGYKGAQATQRMKKYPNIQARVAELMAQTAERSRVTTDQISEQLQAIIARSQDGDSAPMLQATRAAVMDLAKLHGLLDPKGQPKGRDVCTCGGMGITESAAWWSSRTGGSGSIRGGGQSFPPPPRGPKSRGARGLQPPQTLAEYREKLIGPPRFTTGAASY